MEKAVKWSLKEQGTNFYDQGIGKVCCYTFFGHYIRIDYKSHDAVLAILKIPWIAGRYSKLPVVWHGQGIKCSGCARKICTETQFSCDFALFYSFTYFHFMFENRNYFFALVVAWESCYVTQHIYGWKISDILWHGHKFN